MLRWDDDCNATARQIFASLEDSDSDSDLTMPPVHSATSAQEEQVLEGHNHPVVDDGEGDDPSASCTVIEQTESSVMISDGKDVSIHVTKDMLSQWENMLQENFDKTQEPSASPPTSSNI
ncbi:hypothetical protein EON63_07065 [archaeon]|nr:MAG: hypothetical protein EON63_07065 [archaeon]